MLEVFAAVGNASLGAFWVPVIVWTGAASVVALMLALTRRLHPLAGYRLRQGLLLALPACLVAAPWVPATDVLSSVLPTALQGALAPRESGAGASRLVPGPDTDVAGMVLGLVTIAVALLALVRLSMLARDLHQLRRLRLATPLLEDAAAKRALLDLADQLDVRRPARLLEGPPGCVSMTFHWRRPAIVVPRSVIDDPDSMRIVLAHEMIHVRRHDYAWTLLECVVSAGFAFHPLVWLLRRGTERCRETSCDAELVAAGIAQPDKYAEVLVHAHTGARFPMTAVAAGLSTRWPTIKERLETMKRFADTRPTSGLRLGTALASVVLFLVTATLGACISRSERPEFTEVVTPLRIDGRHYVSPVSTESREVTRAATIGRLEVELTYLQERMGELREQADAIPKTQTGLPGKQDYPAYSELVQHQVLLNEMYRERLRVLETLRMEQETEKLLAERGS